MSIVAMAEKPLDVVIIGGSLAGLMHGVMAKRLGHNVRILEQYPSSIREGQAAGLSTGLHGQNFLKKHDRIADRDHFVTAEELFVFDVNLKVTEQRKVPFKLTNWKTLYYRLRANFDGFSSDYAVYVPESLPTDGTASYEVGKRVTDVSYTKESGLSLVYEDMANGNSSKLHPDLVIAADGANSGIRKLMFPELDAPYAGYLTWRGVVPEKDVSEETINFLHNIAIRYHSEGSYIVGYIIPGENGSNTPGERHVNFVWYYNCPKDSDEYAAAITDVDGVQHRQTVPFGKVNPEVWRKQQAYSTAHFAAPIREIVGKIEKPFVTAISDCIAPKSSFFDGRLFLVGDALALFRPHAAQSTNQAALHCLQMERLLKKEIKLEEYEEKVMEFAHSTLHWSREIGTSYLGSDMEYLNNKLSNHLARLSKRHGGSL